MFNFATPGSPRVSANNNNAERGFMLDILRANAKSAFTWLIVLGIVVVFAINFGPGSLSKGGGAGASAPFAARVNGKTIAATEWERQYRQLYQLFRQQAGDAFTRELADQLGLPAQAMEQIVDRELVVQEAKRRGIVVTRQELTRTVHAMPAFQENGAFSFAVYEESARALYGSPAKFEAALKDDLLYRKMMTVLGATVKVSDAEVRSAWEADADRAALSFLRVPVSAAEPLVKIGPAEVEALAAKESARIEKFHQENAARFDQPKKVRVRHVLARVPPGGDDAAARKKLDEAQARLQKGEDFAGVAAAVSDDEATKARGGELGFVAEGLFDEAFVKAAMALEQGQVSPPVRTPSGWHLVQAEEVIPARRVPLEQAREAIARELLVKDRALALARERARAALEAARAGKPLAPVRLGAQTVSPEETGPVTRGTAFPPKLGPAPELLADAFGAKAGQVLGKVYDTPTGPVVAIVKQRERPDPKEFEEQREALRSRLRNLRESQVAGAWLESLRDGAKIETNAALLAAASGESPR